MITTVQFIDRLSAWFGKAFAWCILIMTFGVAYEVFARYLLNAPTAWAFDLSYMMYGAMFMMAGAYTLSRDGHVRGDFLYRLWPPRVQARVELLLYIFFFFPGVLALIFAGYKYAAKSWSYNSGLGEVSVMSPAGMPISQFKSIIVAAGILLFLQGIAQVLRCILCIRHGKWMTHDADVEELQDIMLREAARKKGIPVDDDEELDPIAIEERGEMDLLDDPEFREIYEPKKLKDDDGRLDYTDDPYKNNRSWRR